MNNNTFDVSNGDVPAAGPLGRSGKNKGICSSFSLSLCSPCSGRRRNSILPYAPNHLAFSPHVFYDVRSRTQNVAGEINSQNESEVKLRELTTNTKPDFIISP